MVNKGSFFQRLRDRFGSGSGVRFDADHGADVRTAADHRPGPAKPRAGEKPPAPVPPAAPRTPPSTPPIQRVDPVREPMAQALATDFAPAEVRTSRKLSEKEEAMLALGTHFQELSSLLRGSHARMDDQLGQLIAATASLGTLPALSQQQLDLLRVVSTHMDRQEALGERLATTLSTLPQLLQNVEGALARAAATDERTAATVRDFQSTMDRIHASMGKMVEHSEQQAKASQQLAERRDDSLAEVAQGIERSQQNLEQSQQKAMQELRRTTDESLQSLRRTHEDQSNRLQRIVQENAGWNRVVLVGIGVVVLGLAGLIALQLVR
jgi:hypothetical protein